MALPHTLLTDGAHDEHLSFWTSALGPLTHDLHLRQPWLSPAVTPGRSIEEECPITPETAALIETLGRGQDLGVLVVIVGAASYLLHLHTRTTTVAIDSPPMVAGDPGGNDGDVVPLVTTVDPAASVRDHLTRIGACVGGSYSYQAFPIAAFCDVMLKRPRPRTNVWVSLSGLHADGTDSPDHDLHIRISRTPLLRIHLTGRTPAWSPAFLRGFAAHLSHILEGFRDHSRTLDDIDVMGDEERRRLRSYSASAAEAGEARTIHEVFQEQAARDGAAVAVQWHDTAVTYDTLNRRANQLARFLQSEYGVRPGDVIGVLTHRSPDSIVALLGILKAGAVYLPIDPDYPEDRLQFLVTDAAVTVLLVQSEHFDRLASLYETPMFALDIQLDTLETADTDPDAACAPGDLAYIIYTSGSTGLPKGVLLEHRGFVTMVRHHIGAFGIEPRDKFLQFYGLSFDSSLFEIFVPLLAGATVVLVDRATIDDPAALSAYIERQQITTLTLPPVYSSTLDSTRLSTVRRFISAGDHCRVEDAVKMAHTGAYYNSYGPTETSVCVTHYRVDPAREYGARIPIGAPISGTSIHLLDEQRRLLPEGLVGEICIGGAGLARGYLHRDDLTAAAFVPSPCAEGERLYLTGDLGVWLPDGNLELVGRKDNQVKIRGYRVELGEIESVLDQHPAVRECAVVAREDESGNRRLAAYVTGTSTIDVDDLRALLRSRLPSFMMPSQFTVLDQMPLTANGKIDRKTLATRGEAPPEAAVAAALPQTPVQATLLRIWKDVLGIAHIGIHDNLFDLGGDSILIIQIVSRAREAGLKLAPNQLFDHQTVAQLAEVAVETQAGTASSVAQGPVDGPSPLSPMQVWFFDQRLADAHHFNQSVSLEVPAGRVSLDAAAAATRAVVAHHDALRLRFREQSGTWTADHGPVTDTAPFDVVDLAGVPAESLDEALGQTITSSQTGFDLGSGPLFRVRLIQLGAGRPSRLLMIAHHLVVDGVSWRVLIEDFATAYTQADRGESVALPSKTSAFRSWTTALRDLAPRLDRSYWVADARVAASPLPVDQPATSAANTVGSSSEVTRTLDTDTTTALLQEVPRAYTTEITDVLLAALAMTFRGWTGRNDLSVDLEAHGREELTDEVDTSRTVGWFTSQFPVTLRLPDGASAPDAIKSIKEQLRAVPARGAGYGVLRYLSDDADLVETLTRRPAPQVLFNYFGQAGRVTTPDLQWTLLPAGSTGGDISPAAIRPHLLEINAMITDGTLSVTWTFSHSAHHQGTIETLAAQYEDTLRALVAHCRGTSAPQYTPSDFPSAGLDQQSLDALIAKLNR